MMIVFLVFLMIAALFYFYAVCGLFLVQEISDRKIQNKLKRKTLYILSVTPVLNFLVFIGFALEFGFKVAKENIPYVFHEIEED